MTTKPSTTPYFLYARKSSESDERQVQSIDDQVETMTEHAERLGLQIERVFTESKSAKEPHARPQFEEMMAEIKERNSVGILAWKIDRLSRNPIDSAELQWLLQRGTIQSIHTASRQYLPEDNALLLSIETSMANQYIRDLSKNVRRGLASKLEKGWRPGVAPLGYLNTKKQEHGSNTILVDPKRFPLLRRAWDLMLSGNHNPDAILQKLNGEWGFRTRQSAKRGGTPLARSSIYRIFTNPFYMGLIVYGGVTCRGSHKPMVTPTEFDKVQELLGRPGKPQQRRHSYAYTGIFSCGTCGGTVSAAFKEKTLRSTREHKTYTLYYCLPAAKSQGCSERGFTNVEIINSEIVTYLQKHQLHPLAAEWLIQVLKRDQRESRHLTEAKTAALQETKGKLDLELKNLRHMRLKDMISDEEFAEEKKRLEAEKVKCELGEQSLEQEVHRTYPQMERLFRFASEAPTAFSTVSKERQRELLNALSWNQTLKGKSVALQRPPWLIPLDEARTEIEATIEALEPGIQGSTKGPQGIPEGLRPILRGVIDRIGAALQDGKFRIPDLDPDNPPMS